MRFVDFLKTTVLACAAAATALAAIALLRATHEDDTGLVLFSLAWWLLATLLGATLGRRAETTPPIARLLAAAKSTTTLPEQRPGRVLVNRLWPLMVFALVAGALGLLAPQVSVIATGFAIIGALAWRRQERAVAAIEDRDGVRFYVEPTSPVSPIQLLRTPGFHTEFPSANGAGKVDPAALRH